MNSNSPHIVQKMFDDLGQIGLEREDCVVVHSSYKTLGLKDHCPSDVIATFIEFLGSDGALVMPTFTYSYCGIWNVKPFNPDTTPGSGNGILTEVLRTYPGALRSAHPTYSVAAIGKHAQRITQNKEQASPLGLGSSYGEAYEVGAKILLMGVGNSRNSMLHYAEAVAEMPYNDIPFREFWGRSALVEKDGKTIEVSLPNEFPACSANFGVADAFLAEKGLLKRGKVCEAESMLMDVQDMVTAVADRLRREPAWLLCDNFVCEPCTLAKRRLRERGMI